jgi:uncharacterized protein
MKTAIAAGAVVALAGAANANLIITGVVDGDLPGGLPKAIELYATSFIADASIYGIESANNGNPSGGAAESFLDAVSLNAGDFYYVTTDNAAFQSVFGFAANQDSFGAASINGDDALLLYESGSVIDTFGVAGVNGDGEVWDYTDSWAYRVDGTLGSNPFDSSNFFYGGLGALDGLSAAEQGAAVPFGTYVPTPGALAILGLAGVAGLRRRRA